MNRKRKILLKSFLFIVFISCSSIAQAGKQILPDTIKSVINEYFLTLKECVNPINCIDYAMNIFRKHNRYIIDEKLEDVENQMPIFLKDFQRYKKHKILNSKISHDCIYEIDVLVNFEFGYIFWKFEFYKPKTHWLIYDVEISRYYGNGKHEQETKDILTMLNENLHELNKALDDHKDHIKDLERELSNLSEEMKENRESMRRLLKRSGN